MIFVISDSDGDTHVRQYTEKKFVKALNDKDFGEEPEFFSPEEGWRRDTGYWGGAMLLIRGEIVVPKPKETVTEWEI